jgi:hypothetical protein
MDRNLTDTKKKLTEYTAYDDLPSYDEDTKFLDVLRYISTNIIETPEYKWEIHFTTINELRRLRKHKLELFYRIVNDFKLYKKVFPKFINSIRSNLSKVTLMLMTEVFSVYEFDHQDKWMRYIIPEVLNKSTENKIFIREEAMKCLSNVGENMFYEESMVALLQGVKSPNTKISQNACDTLIIMINNYELNALLNTQCWKEIFKLISDVYLMKTDKQVKKCEGILQTLENKISKETLEYLLRCTNKNSALVIEQIRKSKYPKAHITFKSNESLKDFKKRMMESQSNKENQHSINII